MSKTSLQTPSQQIASSETQSAPIYRVPSNTRILDMMQRLNNSPKVDKPNQSSPGIRLPSPSIPSMVTPEAAAPNMNGGMSIGGPGSGKGQGTSAPPTNPANGNSLESLAPLSNTQQPVNNSPQNLNQGATLPGMTVPEAPASSPESSTPSVSTPGGSSGPSTSGPTNNTPVVSDPPGLEETPPTPSGPVSDAPNVTPPTTPPTDPNPGPSPSGNRPPEVRSMWMQNTSVRWDDEARVLVNGSDPDWDPLSWDIQWSGTNGFSKQESIPGPLTWIDPKIDVQETGLRKGEILTLTATVRDPEGLSDTDSIDIEVRNAPPEITDITTDKSQYLMTDSSSVSVTAEDLDGDDLYWTYEWSGNGVTGSGDAGPTNTLDFGVDLNEAQVLPGQEVRANVVVSDQDGGTDNAMIVLPVIDINNEVDEIGSLEVWFNAQDAQDPNMEVNDPPVINMLGLSRAIAEPGQRVNITGQATDPENMDLTWSWHWEGRNVDQTGQSSGNNITLPDMNTSSTAVPEQDIYTFTATVNDGFLTSESASIDLPIDIITPPIIENINLPSRIVRGRSFTMTGDGHDPRGDDNTLDWSVTASHPVSDTSTRTFVDQETFSTNYGTQSNNAHAAIDVVLTNEHGLTDTARVGIETYDPIVFDLNRDGKVDLVGGAMAEKAITLPAGEWVISTSRESEKASRYVINDVNFGNGTHDSTTQLSTDVHATARWKLGIEQMDTESDWEAIDIHNVTPLQTNSSGQEVSTISAGGLDLTAIRVDDHGYQDDGLGVNSVGGDMVLFDLDPNKSSWSDASTDLRPGMANNTVIPTHPGGLVVYDTGAEETIPQSGVWVEDPTLGDQAKIYNASGEWVAEWVNGDPATYYYGAREDRESTQWLAGNGDGMLVWDHNGNGIIDDSTELMSEFDKEGNVAFADGYEKIAHYFDHNQDGVVRDGEMDGLMLWVDDGDAKTEEGELRSLQDYGIMFINLPQDGSWSSTVGTLGLNSVVQLGHMALFTRSPSQSEFDNHLKNLNSGQSILEFIELLLASDEFQNDVMSQGIDKVIFDMHKNLLHQLPSDADVATGVAEFEAGRDAEYIITLMNDPSVVARFENS